MGLKGNEFEGAGTREYLAFEEWLKQLMFNQLSSPDKFYFWDTLHGRHPDLWPLTQFIFKTLMFTCGQRSDEGVSKDALSESVLGGKALRLRKKICGIAFHVFNSDYMRTWSMNLFIFLLEMCVFSKSLICLILCQPHSIILCLCAGGDIMVWRPAACSSSIRACPVFLLWYKAHNAPPWAHSHTHAWNERGHFFLQRRRLSGGG